MNRAEQMHRALADGQPRTRAELFRYADRFYLTNNAASELREKLRPLGQDVAQWTAKENGQRVHVYQIVGSLDESGCYSASVAADGATGGRAPDSSRELAGSLSEGDRRSGANRDLLSAEASIEGSRGLDASARDRSPSSSESEPVPLFTHPRSPEWA